MSFLKLMKTNKVKKVTIEINKMICNSFLSSFSFCLKSLKEDFALLK